MNLGKFIYEGLYLVILLHGLPVFVSSSVYAAVCISIRLSIKVSTMTGVIVYRNIRVC